MNTVACAPYRHQGLLSMITRNSIIKMAILVVMLTIMNMRASAHAQNVTIIGKSLSISQIMEKINEQTGYQFVYSDKLIQGFNKQSVQIEDESISGALNIFLKKSNLVYEIKNKTIILHKRAKAGMSLLPIWPRITLELRRIHGSVLDSLGSPITGVNVQNLRTKQGTTTDIHGNYEIQAQTGDVLRFSYIGYNNEQITVSDQEEVNVRLIVTSNNLDDIVMIGYGSQKRSDLTGSVGEASIADMNKAPVRSFDEALAGRIAGVVVSSMDGQPGSPINIVIRGNNSITQDNSPLYVVDGFPIENPDNNVINPEDIASISVLKDASATAIYGARGANGVILITTKKGNNGPPKIAFSTSYGIQEVLTRMKLMDPYNFVKFQTEVSPGDTSNVGSGAYYYLRDGHTLDGYKDSTMIDWQSYMFRTAPMRDYNLSLSGGTALTKYSVSGSVLDQDGVVINSGYKRYQGRFVLDQIINQKFKVGVNLNYSHLLQNGISPSYAATSGGSVSSSMMFSVWGYRPFGGNLIEEPFDEDVSTTNDYRFNPIMNQENIVRLNQTNNLIINSYAEYAFDNHLKLRVTGGITTSDRQRTSFNDTLTSYGNPVLSKDGINGSIYNSHINSWVNENTLTYDNLFSNDHHFNMMVGMTEQKVETSTDGFSASKLPLQADGVSWLDAGNASGLSSVRSENALVSFLSRLNYDYRGKYLLTATFRADGSSKFAKNNHWSYFPSTAVAWKFADEDFIKHLKVISEGKIRVSYGKTSNNRVGDFSYLSQYKVSPIGQGYPFNNSVVAGTIPNLLGNPHLKWETTDQWDLGLDMGFLDSRLSMTVDVYRKNTKDLILNAHIPSSYGFNSIYQNVGSVQNQGLEISLSTENIKRKNFSWNSSFNITFNSNKILNLAQNQTSITNLYAPYDNGVKTIPAFIAMIGKPLGLMYGPIMEGVYQYGDFDKIDGKYLLKESIPTNGNVRSSIQPGDVRYKDLDGDGVVSNSDFVVLGRGLPIHSGGFSNNFNYKGFDLNVFFQWSYGSDILNANRIVFEGTGRPGVNQFADYANRWEPDNPSNTYYRAGGEGPIGNSFSSRVIEDGSYLRLKTVAVGYNFSSNQMYRWHINSLRIFLAAQNLYTWTKYSGVDPEVSIYSNVLTPNVDYSAYPRARTVTLGLNLVF